LPPAHFAAEINGLDFAGSEDSGYSIPVIDNIVIDLKFGNVNAKFVDVAMGFKTRCHKTLRNAITLLNLHCAFT
jgi:hypothetical protein